MDLLAQLRIAVLEPQDRRGRSALPDWARCAERPGPSWPENERRWLLEAVADDGAVGRFGPCPTAQVEIIRDQLAPAAVGLPLVEVAELSRESFAGRFRSGPHFMAAWAALDLAVADLLAINRGSPAFAAAPGSSPVEIPAYASLLSVDVHHPLAPEIARWVGEQGFVGAKWSFAAADRERPAAWLAAIEAIAAAAGDRCQLFVDAGYRLPEEHLAALLEAMAALSVAWLEEAAEPISRAEATAPASLPPLAAGEHAFDDAQFEALAAAPALSVWQPEVSWHGPVARSFARARSMATGGRATVPHGSNLPVALAFAAALSPEVAPMVEYNLCREPKRHSYLNDPPTASEGRFTRNPVAGFGCRYRAEASSRVLL